MRGLGNLRKQGHEKVMENRGPPTVLQQGTSVPSLEPSFVPISQFCGDSSPRPLRP